MIKALNDSPTEAPEEEDPPIKAEPKKERAIKRAKKTKKKALAPDEVEMRTDPGLRALKARMHGSIPVHNAVTAARGFPRAIV